MALCELYISKEVERATAESITQADVDVVGKCSTAWGQMARGNLLCITHDCLTDSLFTVHSTHVEPMFTVHYLGQPPDYILCAA